MPGEDQNPFAGFNEPDRAGSGAGDQGPFAGFNDPSPEEVRPTSTPSAHFTPYRQATQRPHAQRPGAPATPAAPPDPASLGEAARLGWQNAPEDFLETGKEVLHGAMHPIQTLKALGDIGGGLVSQAQGELGLHGTDKPADIAKREQAARAMEAGYQYVPELFKGNVKPLYRKLAYNPAGLAMDASMFLDAPAAALKVSGAAAKVAGATRAAEMLGKTGRGLSTAASYVDPVQASLKLAKGLTTKPAGVIARGVHSVWSNVPYDSLKAASDAGAAGPFSAPSRDYLGAQWGATQPNETARGFKSGLSDINEEGREATQKSVRGLSGNPSFDAVKEAIEKRRDEISPRDALGNRPATTAFKAAQDELDWAESLVNEYETKHANGISGHGDVQGFDRLKRAIRDRADEVGNRDAKNALREVASGVSNSISTTAPKYSKLMQLSQDSIGNIGDIASTLGVDRKAPAALNAILKGAKTPRGQNLLQQLYEKNPSLRYQLAGLATKPWGTHSVLNTFLATPLGALGPLGYVAPFATSSPKLAGLGHYAAGAAGAIPDTVLKYGSKPSYLGTREDAMQQATPADPQTEAIAQKLSAGTDLSDPVQAAARGIAHEETGFIRGEDAQYKALGPVIKEGKNAGNRAYGKYQIMDFNIPAWTEEILNRKMTPEEFRNDPAAQEVVAKAKIKQYWDKYHNIDDVAAAWHSGVPLKQAISENRRDVHETTQRYAGNVSDAFNSERAARASGGQVQESRDHEYLVNRLMKAAKSAKVQTDKTTEPLLNVPDAHIVKALDVAQRAI